MLSVSFARFCCQHQTFYLQPFLSFVGVGSFMFPHSGRSFGHTFYYTPLKINRLHAVEGIRELKEEELMEIPIIVGKES